MLAHELRTGDEFREDGETVYRVTRAWTGEDRGNRPVVKIEYRHRDGGDGEQTFDPKAEVPHVRPTSRERVARFVAERKKLNRHLGDRVHELHGGDEAGGCTLWLRDLEAVLEELGAARSYID